MSEEMKRAIYAFSGDPITYGHIDVVTRAAKAFESLTVGIGTNEKKAGKYLFSEDERLDMAKKALRDLPNVDVKVFEGSLVHYAYEQGIQFIVRGIRNQSDAKDELELFQNIESQNLPVDIIYLPASTKYLRVSSTAVKVWQNLRADITSYVPLHVKQGLEEKISGQHMVGVTGTIGAGKSYVTKQLLAAGTSTGIPVHEMDLDAIGHEIISTAKEPVYQEARDRIAAEFNPSLLLSDGTIDRKLLGSIVFTDPAKLAKLNELMATPLRTRFRSTLNGKKGIVAVNAALIAELGWTDVVNNNALLIDVDQTSQVRRLKARGHSDDEVTRRISSQYNTAQKRSLFEEQIAKQDHGKLWTIDNSDGKTTDFETLLKTIAQDLNYKI